MIRRWVVLIAMVLSGCTGAPGPGALRWDAKASADASEQVKATMAAFASTNLEGFKAGLAEEVVGFEIDMESKPVRLASRADAVRFAEETFAQLKKIGAVAKLDIHSTNCYATATLAYCTVEFDFKATMPDGSTMSQPTRNTIVLRKDGDGWKWTHWHSSPASAQAQGGAKAG